MESSANPKETEEKLNELLALQRQYDVVPVEVTIPVDEVIKRYPITSSTEIVRTKNAIFFHSTCFWVISKPTLANNMRGGALYEQLEWFCDYMDSRSEYNSEEKQVYDTVCAMIGNILTLPLDAFTDMSYTEEVNGEEVVHDFFVDVASSILELRNIYYSKIMEQAGAENPETPEDTIALQKIAEEAIITDLLEEEVSKLAEKDGSNRSAS